MFDKLEDLLIRYEEIMGENFRSRVWQMIKTVSVN